MNIEYGDTWEDFLREGNLAELVGQATSSLQRSQRLRAKGKGQGKGKKNSKSNDGMSSE